MFFFFQAEDGIRDVAVTGVQTCALPILCYHINNVTQEEWIKQVGEEIRKHTDRPIKMRNKIGRASCRESVDLGGRRNIKKKKRKKKKKNKKIKKIKKKKDGET